MLWLIGALRVRVQLVFSSESKKVCDARTHEQYQSIKSMEQSEHSLKIGVMDFKLPQKIYDNYDNMFYYGATCM